MIAEALDYTRRGLSVFPVRRNKKPAVNSWKRFQGARASEDQIRQWFEENAAEGIAVVCGAISGDLVVRDYDDEDAYHAWTIDHPDLARALPTAETGRTEWQGKNGKGYQVWVRSPGATFLDFDGGGELRNEGHYVVAPPSLHESGKRYQWIVPLTNPIPEVDLAGVGLLEGNRAIRSSCSVCSGSSDCSACSVPLNDAIAEAVRETVPKIEGTRNKSIWRLVRELKAIPDLHDAPLGRLEPIVRSWHGLAMPNIKTRDWDTTWADFIIAWDRCKHAKGSSDVETNILGNAESLPVPKCAKRYDTDPVRALVAVCAALQALDPSGPFFLSVRAAGKAIGIRHRIAWAYLRMLTKDGILEVAEPGNEYTATRYRYIASDENKLPRV